MSKSVVIAESSDFFSKVLSETLTLLGFTVAGTTSKSSGLNALLSKTKPDLLIFDLNLSKASWNKLNDIKGFKEQLPEMKVVALGIHEATDHLLEAIKNVGFDGFWNIYDKRTEFTKILTLLFP